MVSCVDCGISHTARKFGIRFHRFPKDPAIRNIWLAFVGKIDGGIPKYCYLCSQHFTEDDLDETSKLKIQLKKKAVPSVKIMRSKYTKCTEASLVIEEPVTTPSTPRNLEQPLSPQPSFSRDIEETPRKKRLREEIRTLSLTNICKSRKIRRYQKLKWAQKRRIFKLTNVIKELHNKNFLHADHTSFVMKEFGHCESLINRLLNKTTGRKTIKTYNEEIRNFAVTLHFFSAKSYNYVRKYFNNCLPHPKTLSKWYSRVDARPGFTTEILDMLKIKNLHCDKKLVCSLVMDEMSIREKIEYTKDKYYGYVDFGVDHLHSYEVANKALVFMIVAINDTWKVPVGYFFIASITSTRKADLTLQCLTALSECGIHPINLTFDGCVTNLTMSEILGCRLNISELRVSFSNDFGYIYIMPDPSHMIKLIRNFFGDKKIIIDGDGNEINFYLLDKLVELQETEGLCLANKIRKSHINYFRQKMKVKLATQLLSRSVADALKFCRDILKISEFENGEATIKFVIIMNDAFDILNSHKISAYGYKKALCSKNIRDIEAFTEMFEKYACGLKFKSGERILDSNRKTGLLGFCICLKSIIEIYHKYMTGPEPLLKFLPVYKCSQDHLELFFASVRSHGGHNDNPSCMQFTAAYKKLIIHAEVRDGGLGNCVPLEYMNILRCSSSLNKPEQLINDQNLIYHETNSGGSDEEDEIYDIYCHLGCRNNISNFSKEVATYIAGFVSRKLSNCLKCEICVSSLFGDRANFMMSFIHLKDRGGLSYPSNDVIKVCLATEKLIRCDLSRTKYPCVNKHKILIRVLNYFQDSSIFENIKNHCLYSTGIENHVVLLIKAITNHYANIRIRYACNNVSPVEKIRSQYTKLIQFRGQ